MVWRVFRFKHQDEQVERQDVGVHPSGESPILVVEGTRKATNPLRTINASG